MPAYLQQHLGDTEEFLQMLTEADEEELRISLPGPLYDLIFRLTLRPCADAVIVDDRNTSVVLVRRETGTKQEGAWNLPGGVVRYGERYRDAVLRKARAETGLDVMIDENIIRQGIIGLFDDYSINDRAVEVAGNGYEINNPGTKLTSSTTIYLARPVGGRLKESARFYDWNQLPAVIAAPHRQAINIARQLIEQLYRK